MHRRDFVLLGLAGLAACKREPLTAARTPELKLKALDGGFPDLAQTARPGVFNAAVMNLEGGETWYWNADRPMPLGPCAALPILAACLGEIDAGRLSLAESLILKDMDLSPPPSPIATAWPQPAALSVEALMSGAASGDNTAMDVLTRRIGGPGAVKAWLQSQGIIDMHVDRYRREAVVDAFGLSPFRPAWRDPATFNTVVAKAPDATRQAAMATFISDGLDKASTQSGLSLLGKIGNGGVLSSASRSRLLSLMSAQADRPGFAAGLPAGARLAQISGTQMGWNGVCLAQSSFALCTLADGRIYGVCAMLSGSPAPASERDALFARFMRIAVDSFA